MMIHWNGEVKGIRGDVECSRVRFLDRQMFQLKPNSDSAHIPRQIQSLKLT